MAASDPPRLGPFGPATIADGRSLASRLPDLLIEARQVACHHAEEIAG